MKRIQWHVKATLLAFFVSTTFALAQTTQERQEISNSYDQTTLTQLSQKFKQKEVAEKQEALRVAAEKGWEVMRVNNDGSIDELMKVSSDGKPVYYTVYNEDAARSTRADHLNIGGSTGFNLDGQNMTAHVWDGGATRPTHQEFDGPGGNNRVTINDGVTSLNGNSFHAQHVTGTIVASGVQAAAKGMAPQADALTHDWNSDLSEATTEAANGMLLSNHSYGYRANLVPDWYFGAYLAESRDWDDLMHSSPFYLMVVAAGNDGNDNSSNGAPLNGNSSYDKLTGHSTSKNNLVVANGQDANVNNDGTFNSVVISSSSSEGPTDDLRIKPDITGNGSGVYSTYDGSDTQYNSISGTSMASPNVTGTLLLLQQHYNNLNGSYMRAATLKGLALHTADDAGNSGPDVVYGWGLLNGKVAAETISNNGGSSVVSELTLSAGQTYSLNVDSDGSSPLMASISWTDPAGTANTGTANLTTPVLVNDLDIRVTQGGTTYSPYRLTSITSNNTGDNNVDPFERVDVSSASGAYTIEVTHKGSLSGGSQNFSLVVTGVTGTPPVCNATTPTGLNASSVGLTTATLGWGSVPGATYDVRYRATGTSTWTNVNNVSGTSTNLSGLSSDTQYEAQVRSECPDNSTSAYSSSANFTTSSTNCSGGTSSFPYTESFENTFGTWTQSTSDDMNWSVNSGGTPSTGTGPTGANDGTYYIYMEVSSPNYPTKRAILTSACFDLTGESGASVTFDYQMTGGNVGTVDLEASNDNGNSWSSIWSQSGDQGSAWNNADVNLGAYAGGTLLLRFNGVSGASWDGDIAIDNLEVTVAGGPDTQAPTAPTGLVASNVTQTTLTLNWNASTDNVGVTGYDVYQGSTNIGTVTTTSSNVSGLTAGTSYSFSVIAKDGAGNQSASSNVVNVTTQSAGGGSCSSSVAVPYSEGFESNDGWTQVGGDDGDWVRDANGTPSSGTGPSSAVEGSYYMFLEASTNGSTGQIGNNATAILESDCFDLSGESSATFSFQYHMYGNNVGSLTVQTSDDDGATWTQAWTLSGNQGNSWSPVNVDLSSFAGGDVKLRLVGTTGNGWSSDIAVDDLSVTGGGGGGGTTTVDLTLNFDNYPEETSWQILDGSTVVASGGTYPSQPDGSTLVVNIPLNDGCYDFVISDSYGDGICCGYGNGSYTLTDGSTTLASGGSFGSSETTNFCVSGTTSTSYYISTSSVGQPSSFEIYPNPVTGGELNIATTRSDVSYRISNVAGQIVASGKVLDNKVDVGSLDEGIYMIQLESGGKSLVRKFVKE